MEGDHWYRIRSERVRSLAPSLSVGLVESPPEDVSHEVQSNGRSDDFERLFRLEAEWGDVEERLLQRGPELEPLIEALPGLRLTRPSDPVETMFSFLCSSNNHVPRIAKMVDHLASLGPVMDELGYRAVHRFPGVERIAETDEAELRARGFGYRAKTIPQAARLVAGRGGSEYLRQLGDSPLEDARRQLLELPGVGPKLADCILLFALGRTEAVPVDTHVWQALTRHYFPDWQASSLTPAKYSVAAGFMRDRFGSLAGWAQQFLFFENMLNWRFRKQPNG